MMISFRSAILVGLAGLIMVEASLEMSDEKRLIKHLLENYEKVGKIGRPVYNQSEALRVDLGLTLIQILDLDEANQILTGNYWLNYAWNDVLLKWNPDDFGNIQAVRVPIDKIWKPDVVLFNDVSSGPVSDVPAVVSYNGAVMWIPPAVLKSTCAIDMYRFPSDTQHCILKFGSWTFDGYQLDLSLNHENMDLSHYVTSPEWNLLDTKATKNTKYYPCCPEPYIDVTFTLEMKRRDGPFKFVMVYPAVMLSLLSLCIFWLPTDSNLKISLGVFIFAVFFYLLLVLIEVSPPAVLPSLGVFYGVMMLLMMVSICQSVIVMLLGRKTSPVPKLLRCIIPRARGGFGSDANQPITGDEKQHLNAIGSADTQGSKQGSMDQDVSDIREMIQHFSKTGSNKEMRAKNAEEWKMVAKMLDLAFFVLYLILIICLMASFL